MIKSLLIILSILNINNAFATNQTTTVNKNNSLADIVDQPNKVALNIMVDALSSLKDLKKQKQANIKNIEELIRIKLLPNIATDVAAKLALKEHWNDLDTNQQKMFQDYIVKSLIKDYVGILGAYDELDGINISVEPEVRRKDNKVIIKLIINIDENSKPILTSLKMIHLEKWFVYDMVFSGVSLIKNYSAQFNSHIKRKGLDSLVIKIAKKLK